MDIIETETITQENIPQIECIDPSDADGYMRRACAAERSELWGEVVDHTTKAIEINSSMKEAYFLRGKALMLLEKRKNAIQDFTRAIALDDRFAEAYEMRGKCYSEKILGGEERAIADLRKANKLKPNDATFHFNLGSVFIRTDEFHRAIEELTLAIQLDPKMLMAYRRRGYCRYHLKHYERAVEDYSFVLHNEPENIKIGRAHV